MTTPLSPTIGAPSAATEPSLTSNATTALGLPLASSNTQPGTLLGKTFTSEPLPTSPIVTVPTTDSSLQPIATTIERSSNTLSFVTSTAPKPSPSISPARSSIISAGAVAGVAIGSFLAGASLFSCILWFFYGKRKRQRTQNYETSALVRHTYDKESPTAITAFDVKKYTSDLERILPQPMEDKAISGEISRISNLIKNHVQSYYRNGRIELVGVEQEDVRRLDQSMLLTVETLQSLLQNPNSREIALRFCIAWTIITRMESHSEDSLLPQEIVRFLQQLAGINQNSHGKC